MDYTTDHTLQVAIEMERLGQTFYDALAEGCAQTEIAELSRVLAREEHGHEELFSWMRNQLPANQRKPAMTESDLFQAARELRRIILPTPQSMSQVVLRGDIHEVLDMAIQMESEAVDYYSSLAATAGGRDVAVIDGIVAEEQSHLRTLQEYRLRCTNSAS